MAALTALAIGAAVVGEGIRVYGQIKANRDQAKAEQANAAFYQEQAEFARQATERELSLFNYKSEQFTGNQISQLGKTGAGMGASAFALMADTRLQQMREAAAILENGRMQEHEALLKAGASQEQASRLTSFSNNFLPAAGAVLTTGINIGTQLRKSA